MSTTSSILKKLGEDVRYSFLQRIHDLGCLLQLIQFLMDYKEGMRQIMENMEIPDMVTILENKIYFVKINFFCHFVFMLIVSCKTATGMLFGLCWLGQMDNWARRTTSACSFLVSSFNFYYD